MAKHTRHDPELESYAIAHSLTNSRSSTQCPNEDATLVAHSLRADGFDASEDGTGRGTPLVAVGRGGDVAATLQSAVGGNGNAGNGSEMIVGVLIAFTGGASEDGTGRGTPLVPISFRHNASFAEHGVNICGTLNSEKRARHRLQRPDGPGQRTRSWRD